LLRHVLRL
jgi:hypothetical protein